MQLYINIFYDILYVSGHKNVSKFNFEDFITNFITNKIICLFGVLLLLRLHTSRTLQMYGILIIYIYVTLVIHVTNSLNYFLI